MDDTKKNSEGGHSTNSKKVENLDSPQFQEMVRGFMVEKELLEKRHQEEIEKLKENFSKKESLLSESHGEGRVSGEASQLGYSNSAMTGQSVQRQMMLNGASSSQQNEEAYSGSLMQSDHSALPGDSYGTHSKGFSPRLPSSYHSYPSGQLSTMSSGSAPTGSHAMMNAFTRHCGQIGSNGELMRGGVNHHHFAQTSTLQNSSGSQAMVNGFAGHSNQIGVQHHNGPSYHGNTYDASDYTGNNRTHAGVSMNGTAHHHMNGHHAFASKDTSTRYHHDTSITDQTSGVYHATGVKTAHHSTTWNPTFYTHNLYPPRDTTGIK